MKQKNNEFIAVEVSLVTRLGEMMLKLKDSLVTRGLGSDDVVEVVAEISEMLDALNKADSISESATCSRAEKWVSAIETLALKALMIIFENQCN